MKRLIVSFIIFCLFAVNAPAQFSVRSTNGHLQITSLNDLDALVLINGIDNSTEITYTGGSTPIEWRKYDNSFYSNVQTISPDDATGYILLINGVPQHYIWVIDYSLYPCSFQSITLNTDAADICDNLTLDMIFSAPDLVYYDKNNIRHTYPRNFTLSYDDLAFNNDAWEDAPQLYTQAAPFVSMTVPAPKQDVRFTFYGDDIAERLGLIPDTLTAFYTAVAVEAHPKGTIEERTGLNEKDRGSTSNIRGSAPLIVLFESRANMPTANYIEWQIYNVLTPTNILRYTDANPRYSFQQTGEYIARLTVNSLGGCEVIDSLRIQALESYLEVPNVFTPNGDGINEEFRVAFRSLISYKCMVMNRWGRVVYSSTDPTKGWDGRINGKPAAEGTYYYLITATGADKDSKGKHIMYKEKGDINLLRGR